MFSSPLVGHVTKSTTAAAVPAGSGRGRSSELFADLGRATMRGVRRCPCCGTLNGTRGSTCKNRRCAVAFRERSGSGALAACRLVTEGRSERVFSVRHRQSGPEIRGFVQLSINSSSESATGLHTADHAEVNAADSHCYISSCRNTTRTSFCRHVLRVTTCCHQSAPLHIDKSVVSRLTAASFSIKQQLVRLIADSGAALVQRVSVSYFAVRCVQSCQFPVGFLHVLCAPYSSHREKSRQRFHCSCAHFKESSAAPSLRRCLHLYACVCAFLSNSQLSQEFQHLTKDEANTELLPGNDGVCSTLDVLTDLLSGSHSPEVTGVIDRPSGQDQSPDLNSLGHAAEVNVHVVGDPSMLQATNLDSASCHVNMLNTAPFSTNDSAEHTDTPNHISLKLVDDRATCRQRSELIGVAGDSGEFADILLSSRADARSTLAADVLLVRADTADCLLVTRSPLEGTTHDRPNNKDRPANRVGNTGGVAGSYSSGQLSSPGSRIVEPSFSQEVGLWVSFYEWLGGVTEMINCSMHYADSGQPEPLVFLVPQAFFSTMKQRIAFGVKKRRLPNEVATIQRTERPPAGQFLRYTWFINNIIHVKAIFDSPAMPLDVTRNFVHCTETDTYRWSPTTTPSSGLVSNQGSSITAEQQLARTGAPIQPQHYRTVLKVGCMSQSQTEPTPFIIEWIANLLPSSGVGELTLKFQFVHQHNGMLVPPPVIRATR